MIKSTSTIRTLAIAMLLLVFHLASNRTPHHVTSFSFDQHVAPDSRAVVGVPSTHHHVVGIHRPVPLQLRDQQQQQQHRSILLADSILFQTLSDTTKQLDDSKSTPLMIMSEEALTPQWKSNDELLESKKTILSSFLNYMFSPIVFIRAYQMSISMRRNTLQFPSSSSSSSSATSSQLYTAVPSSSASNEEDGSVITNIKDAATSSRDRRRLTTIAKIAILALSVVLAGAGVISKRVVLTKHLNYVTKDWLVRTNRQMIIIIVSSMITIVANMITFFIKMNNKK